MVPRVESSLIHDLFVFLSTISFANLCIGEEFEICSWHQVAFGKKLTTIDVLSPFYTGVLRYEKAVKMGCEMRCCHFCENCTQKIN